jgi:hypothetical protein
MTRPTPRDDQDANRDLDDRATGEFLRDFMQRHSVPLVDNDDLFRAVQESIDEEQKGFEASTRDDEDDSEIAEENTDPPGVLDG